VRGGCVCCFVLLTRYWGIVTVPGSFHKSGDLGCPDPHPPRGYTVPLLFLFERTHNYPVDNQGLLPWRLRCLGESKVRSASLVTVLSVVRFLGYSGPKICEIFHLPRISKAILVFFLKKKKENPKEKDPRCSQLRAT